MVENSPPTSDAERRARQCERLSRVLRVLRYILGPGRWDAEALASELECSCRTIHRDLQTLAMAGVPFYFDKDQKAYRVREGFQLSALERASLPSPKERLLPQVNQLLEQVEQFAQVLREFSDMLEQVAAEEHDQHGSHMEGDQ